MIESGKLGEIVEIENHFDYYRPVTETKPGLLQNGAFYGLVMNTMNQMVKMDYPKFIVHRTKGSFVKYGIDQQETSLKANIMLGEPGFVADESVGVLEYVSDEGITVERRSETRNG